MAEFRRVLKQSRPSYRADQASLTPVYPPFHDDYDCHNNNNGRSEASGWDEDDFSYDHTEPKCKSSEFVSSVSGWGTDGDDDHLYAAAAGQEETYDQEGEEEEKEEVVVDLRENERFVAEITSIVPMVAPKSSSFKVSTHNKFALLDQEEGDDDSDDDKEEVNTDEEINKSLEEIKKLEEELKKEEEEFEKIKEQIKKKKEKKVPTAQAQDSGRYWWCSIL